ncbi:MAG: outer membrane protein assembly factor BamE [Methylophagaceae bacterium]|jgi:outer membrane protein assembly factor BamE
MKTVLLYTFSFLVLFITGCAKDKIPGVYRIDIQQGNDITQEMINQLKSGMSKNQVAYVMGTPLVIDTFHPDRWDYIYSYHPGNGKREQRRITVYFKNETLNYLDGDTRIIARAETSETAKADSNVVVPLSNKKTGLFEEIKEKMGIESEEVIEEPSEKVDLFKNRPIPTPTQPKGLIERITGSTSADKIENDAPNLKQETKTGLLKRFIGLGREEETADTKTIMLPNSDKDEVIVQEETSELGLFQRFKNAIGITD